jgi:phage-related protein
MKKIKSWILTLLLPVLGFLLPQYADPDVLSLTFSSLAGIVGLVVIIVNGLKAILKYSPETSWKYLPKLLSILVSVILCTLAWWLKFGMFADLVIVWWQVIATGLVAAGVSMLWYDLTFGEMLLKLIGILNKKK